jgi:hypothetical protein
MGKHCAGTMNENGSIFAELWRKHSLKIGGTLSPHKECHKNTWYYNEDVTIAQLDHVCISSWWIKTLLDVSVAKCLCTIASLRLQSKSSNFQYPVPKLEG